MTGRDAQLDNVKGGLMVLVLTGHLVQPVPNPDAATDAAYLFIYLFHMPMFALVSGFLSHGAMDTARAMGEARKLLAPYAVFEVLQWLALKGVGQPAFPWYEGHFGLWFLLSLFCWRMALPLVLRLPVPLAWSIGAALACGYVPWIGLPLSLSRTVVFLPFFLAGYLMRGRGMRPGSGVRPLHAACFLLLVAALCVRLSAWDLQPLVYGAYSYGKMHLGGLTGPGLRLVRLALGFGAGLAFMAVLPRGDCFLTRIGRRSLYVYLLHGPLLALYRTWPPAWETFGRTLWLMVPAALALALFLSSGFVARVADPLVRPLDRRAWWK